MSGRLSVIVAIRSTSRATSSRSAPGAVIHTRVMGASGRICLMVDGVVQASHWRLSVVCTSSVTGSPYTGSTDWVGSVATGHTADDCAHHGAYGARH